MTELRSPVDDQSALSPRRARRKSAAQWSFRTFQVLQVHGRPHFHSVIEENQHIFPPLWRAPKSVRLCGANSSTRHILGARRRIASVSISSNGNVTILDGSARDDFETLCFGDRIFCGHAIQNTRSRTSTPCCLQCCASGAGGTACAESRERLYRT